MENKMEDMILEKKITVSYTSTKEVLKVNKIQ